MPNYDLLVSVGPLVDRLTSCAYLDPGTGSYALQLILAGAFGGLFALKQSWRQCRTWLSQLAIDRRKSAANLEGAD